jgi:hypothetical protein
VRLEWLVTDPRCKPFVTIYQSEVKRGNAETMGLELVTDLVKGSITYDERVHDQRA